MSNKPLSRARSRTSNDGDIDDNVDIGGDISSASSEAGSTPRSSSRKAAPFSGTPLNNSRVVEDGGKSGFFERLEKAYEEANPKQLERLKEDYRLYGSLLFVSLGFYLVTNFGESWIMQQLGARSELKPYESFEAFYPFYLTQHADRICRFLHFCGTSIIVFMMVKSFDIFLAMIPASLIGWSLMKCTSDIDHGIVEGGVMIVIFLGTNRLLSRSYLKGLAVLLIGYGFAWVGHFYYELNRPATFIYPLYSLMGDFKMWYQIATMQRDFQDADPDSLKTV